MNQTLFELVNNVFKIDNMFGLALIFFMLTNVGGLFLISEKKTKWYVYAFFAIVDLIFIYLYMSTLDVYASNLPLAQ